MATRVVNYQCPACTGPLRFDSSSARLVCEYCDSAFEPSEIEATYAKKEEAAADAKESHGAADWRWSMAGSGWSEEEAARLRAYSCPSCGAEIVCDDTTAATACHYCGNPTVVPGQLSGMLRPDYVIPFKLDKIAAVAALKGHYKGKLFLPKSFRQENHIAEIKGVYVPFWLYDANTDADIEFDGTKVHSHRSGDEEITITEHYCVLRRGGADFERIPVDGSTKMPDAHMDAIEPFNYAELRPFSTAYLPGFLADKYDVDAQVCGERANTRIKASTEELFRATAVGYTTLAIKRSHVGIHGQAVRYALLPVWMLSTRWKDKSFLFAMNGQTGKLIGDLPVSRGRFWTAYAAITLVIGIVLSLIVFLWEAAG